MEEKILLLFVYNAAKDIPNAEYGIIYNASIGVLMVDITCNPPKMSPLTKQYMNLLDIKSLILFLNINSSVIGAYIATLNNIYSGAISISFLTDSSLPAMPPLVITVSIRLLTIIIPKPSSQYLNDNSRFSDIFLLKKFLKSLINVSL